MQMEIQADLRGINMISECPLTEALMIYSDLCRTGCKDDEARHGALQDYRILKMKNPHVDFSTYDRHINSLLE